MEAVVQRKPKGRGWILLGALCTITGLAGTLTFLALFVAPFYDTFTEPILSAPGEHTLDLEPGEYDIWALTDNDDSREPLDPVPYDEAELNLDIVGPDGQLLILKTPATDSTTQRDGETFVVFRVAKVNEAGDHVVRFTTEDDVPTQAIVSRTIIQTALDGSLMIIGAIVSLILLATGVALMGGGWYTLNRQKKEAMTASERGATRARNELLSEAWTEPARFESSAPVPSEATSEPEPEVEGPTRSLPRAGWYPDPDDPDSKYRWWVGRAWTDQTRDR